MPFLKLEYERRPYTAQETPQSFFDRVQGEYSCLLESGKDGRYSYIAYDPFLLVWCRKGVVQTQQMKDFFGIKRQRGANIVEQGSEWPVLEALQQYQLKADGPVPFCGGAVGYLSYDYGAGFVGLEQKVFDDVEIPCYMFGLYDQIIAFDHHKRELYFMALGETDVAARRSIERMKQDLQQPLPLSRMGAVGEMSSNMSQETYERKVHQIKDLLRSGDTYQVNFSQRFSGECTTQPWTVYKKLADRNPSPFACYFEYSDFSIVSSSPELLLRKRGGRVESWPIKGTVPRGATPEEDEIHIDELLASHKDDAELSMIVDLVRNDLGKICEVGSVQVDAHREIWKYSHVIHTVSRVSGKLAQKKTIFDCLQALFPGGSITGCPKKRTMEIIDQLEDYKRGIYTGSAGFISFSGDADFNILIRTMLLKDNMVHFHAGGGIVMDSDPAKEYQETLDKVEALRLSLD